MAGRELPPTSAFAGDDGSADPVLRRALQAWTEDPGTLADVVAALGRTRVLVPVLSPGVDRSTTTAALAAPDGRTALPVFTQVNAMTAWHADARPVPVTTAQAAGAALAEGWELLVVDPAGPVAFVVPGPAVRALAAGAGWSPAVVDGAVRAEVAAAVERASAIDEVRGVVVLPGRRAEVAVVLTVRAGLGRAALDGLLDAVGRRLSVEPVVAEEVDSLEIRVERAVSVEIAADEAPAPARAARSLRRADRRARPG